MRKLFFATIITLLSVSVFAQKTAKDEEAIKKVIQEAYVDGLQNKIDLDKTRAGFHEGFNLLGVNNNSLTKFPIYSWLEYAEMKKSEMDGPLPKDQLTTVKFLNIDITGTAAVAKIELHKEGKHTFTDYLSLYKFEEGWRIVNKIYYKIPE
jgi:hypothetical protein